MASVIAKVRPELLVWARESIGLELETAADKMKVPETRLEAWESGEESPTIPQLRKLGEIYKRPIAIFFLPVPPLEFDALRDFRRVTDRAKGDFSPELRFCIRQAQQRRMAALELAGELGEDLRRHRPTLSLRSGIVQAAAQVRDLLRVELDEQVGWRHERDALAAWIEAAEAADILVFQSSGVTIAEMRGFAISEEQLPVIMLNGKDAVHGRIFTLFHELVHLLLGESGVSDLQGRSDHHSRDDRIEVFCNAVAAEALVPAASLLALPMVARYTNPVEWEEASLDALSRRYRVSSEVILRRLLAVGKTTPEYYDQMRHIWQARARQASISTSTGGPTYPLVPVRNMGHLYIKLGLEAYHSDMITARDLSAFLNMKLKHLPRVEEMVLGGLVRDDILL